jgi:hypothetical protein
VRPCNSTTKPEKGQIGKGDITSHSMSDTPQLRGRFGLPPSTKPGVGYPVAKVMGLMDAATGLFATLIGVPLFTQVEGWPSTTTCATSCSCTPCCTPAISCWEIARIAHMPIWSCYNCKACAHLPPCGSIDPSAQHTLPQTRAQP